MTARWWCEHARLADGVHRDVLVTVVDGRFAAVEPGTPRPAGVAVLPGLVLPGLANVHSHAFHRLLRARTQRGRGSFWTWRDLMYRVADRLDPDGYREVATAVFAEMALAGVTGVGEFHYLHHGPGGSRYADPNEMGSALVDAARAAGVRLTLLDTCYLAADLGGRPLAGAQLRFGDGSGAAWAERATELHARWEGAGDVVVGAAVHSVRAVPPEHVPEIVGWAAAHRAPLHVHVAEQVAEVQRCREVHGRTPVGLLHRLGALGPRTTAVHATHLTDRDVADLRSTGTGVCFCPTTERDLGDGIGPAPALLAAPRGPFGLGSDSHAVIDLFDEARAVELDERLRSRERGVLDAATLLDCATVEGHRALGRPDAGTIAVGARADLVAVDLGSVRTAGCGASAETAVFAASAADVTDVVVDGRVVVADRRHRTVPDAGRRLAAVTATVLDRATTRGVPV
ncbi:formimidoylglutamate deiminase [Pseudonocardia sp. HH130630-07]|uniref:formimidoylglutamate deiminase n=1 Tax=Pseudonocardia sp. HH130630-07 TaxID=1690815 RepID=UPI0008153CD6|nr:formimidoylglutamate deiminase [Pseudonocardia sp. HH130630-07]ANY09359.1 formimidoylglutamate deiminase [Pseudonocardia sp. HH130630-07]